MKKLVLTLLALAALTSTLFAQAPHGFNYQMVVRNSAGQLMSNRTVSVRIRITQGSETGTVVYQNIDNYNTNANGLVTMVVGENSTQYAGINWGNGPFFIVTDVDPNGGNDFTLHTAQQILSVPYAEYCRVADNVSSNFTYDEQDPKFRAWGYDYDSLVGAPDRLSQFINDLNFLTNGDMFLTLSGRLLCLNGVSCVTLPLTTSISWDSVVGHPTTLSQFINDLVIGVSGNVLNIGGQTVTLPSTEWDSIINHPTNLSQFTNDLNLHYNGDTLFFGSNYVIMPNVEWDSIINRPTKLSQFINDLNLSDFNNDITIDWDSINNRPLNLSQFVNDITLEWDSINNHPTNLSQFNNDITIDWDSINNHPTRLSEFINDLPFYTKNDTLFFDYKYVMLSSAMGLSVRWTDIISHPTNLSQFNNDINLEWDSINNRPLNLSQFNNDIKIEWDSVNNHPTNLSQFINDITLEWDSINNHPTKLSQFINDIRIDWDSIDNHPTNLSQFTNDLSLSDFTNDLGLADVLGVSNSANNIIITDLPLPTNNYDAANKLYVDRLRNDMNDSITNLNTNITNLRSDMNDSLTALRGDVNTYVTNLHNELVDTATAIRNDMNNGLTNLRNDMNDSISDLRGDVNTYVTNLHNELVDTATAIRNDMNNGLTNLHNELVDTATAIRNDMNDLRNDLNDSIDDLRNDMNDSISDLRGDVNIYITKLHNELVDTAAAIRNDMNDLRNDLNDSIDDLRNDMNDSIADLRGDVNIYVTNLHNELVDTANAIRNDMNDMRNDINDSLADLRNDMNDSIAVLNGRIDSLLLSLDSLNQMLFDLNHERINGELNGIFSVSPTKKVRFSQGNLQYRPRISTWRFAQNQWDIAGSTNNNANMGIYCNDWIDLFGYGTSGWDGGANNFQPYQTNTYDMGYTEATDGNDLTGMYANGDWGYYNPIINGNNQSALWRTMTYSEWIYLLNDRANATNLRGLATVESVAGYILLPDNWVAPAGITFTNVENSYTINVYNATQWAQMEAAGAVFLPAAGFRDGTIVTSMGVEGEYWSANHVNGTLCWSVKIEPDPTGAGATPTRTNASRGCSVRLVRDYK